ncbi:MAG: penicillin-binding transpeptidase domain-containing protein [Bacteroidetes bacterium]|nr:penicillin-binding transpeptidase domain-containing protein [Bacteroidota bacterium]
MKDENKDIVWRIKLVYIGLLIFAIYIIYKVIEIQFVEGKTWRSRSENLTLRYETVEATRGNIISSDSNLLATSVPIFDVKLDLDESVISADTFDLYIDDLADSLAQLFHDKSSEDFKTFLNNGRKKADRDFLLRRDIDYSQLKRLRTFPIFKKGKYKGGFIVEEKDFRKMPFKELASRTIGYKNINENLYVGLEGAYSKELEGVSGKRLMRKIANGIWRPVERDNQIEPENGKDIITSIDINIQDVAEHALRRCLDSNAADHGCAILMEVSTGYIKAIANLKRHKDGSYGEDINYAIWESAEPGSTFKLASLIAVLEDGKFDTNEIVNSGRSTYADRVMEDSHEQGYGRISFARAFEVSSNVGISEITYRTFHNNPQKYIDYLYSMSLNKPLGLDIKGEGLPYVKNTKDKFWSATSLPWMSIGYELQLTPLQTLTLYNAIANNGKMVKPLFVKEILQTGKLIEKKEAVTINKSICSETTLKKVQKILEGVVERGTAKHLMNTVYKIAGKTGTAKIGYGADKESKVYRASFVGYFPADNPKYSCIVVVNNPTKGVYYGGAIAAPVFKEIADKVYATQLEIHQEKDISGLKINIPFVSAGNQKELYTIYANLNLPFQTSNPEAEYISGVRTDSLVKYSAKTIAQHVIPDVQGMGVREAAYLLEKSGVKVKISGKGKVVSQSINAGTPVTKGQIVTLTLTNVSYKNSVISKDSIHTTVTKAIDSNKIIKTVIPPEKKITDAKKTTEPKKATVNTQEKAKGLAVPLIVPLLKPKDNTKGKIKEKPKEDTKVIKAKTEPKKLKIEAVKAKVVTKKDEKESKKVKTDTKTKKTETKINTQKKSETKKEVKKPEKKTIKKSTKPVEKKPVKKTDKKTEKKTVKKTDKKIESKAKKTE